MSVLLTTEPFATLPAYRAGATLRSSMAESTEPLLQDCTKCGTLIDVTDEEPFARMHCPSCGEALRVRCQFDHFEIQETLGSGGMGTVYRALDHNLHRSVALKLLRKDLSADPEFIRQFEHEAAITALITHPHVVKVYSTGADRGLFFIAMELVNAGSLDDLMTSGGPVPELRALELGIQIAQGLNAALKRGLIHRDVKPGNILFADARNSKIVDFGLAVRMEDAGMVGGEIWGTPYYVAPEKLANQPEDFRSDMYSLAASLYHAIAAKPPCETEDATINTLLELKRSLKSLEEAAPGVSSETAYVINRALKADPDKRYQTYEDFIEHLEYAKTVVLKRDAAAKKASSRGSTKDAEAQRAVSWVTLGILAAIALGGAATYQFREILFGPETSAAAAQPTVVVAATPAERYAQARALLAEGEFSEAAMAFRAVENDAATTRPLRDWAALHAGLSSLLTDGVPEAQEDFRRLAAQGAFSHEPGRAALAEFFVKTGERLGMEDAAPLPAEKGVTDHRTLLPLLEGAKAWSKGELVRAGSLFRQFGSGEPDPAHEWIVAYRPVAARLASEAETYGSIIAQWESASTAEAQALALPKLRSAAAAAKLPGKAGQLLDSLIEDAERVVSKAEAERKRVQSEYEIADAKAFAEVRAKMELLFFQYQYAEARGVVLALQPRSEKGRIHKDRLLKRADWLLKFKLALMQDLTAHKYASPILKQTGEKLAGNLVSASEAGLSMMLPFGRGVVPWADVSRESAYTMGRTFLRLDSLPDRAADRRWHLGIFALQAGKHDDGKAWLQQAAQLKPAYRAQIPDALLSFGLSDAKPGSAPEPAGV